VRGVVVVSRMCQGPLGRLEHARGEGIGTSRDGNEGEVVDRAVSRGRGVRSTRSEAGDGADEVSTGAASALTTRSVARTETQ